MTKSYISFLGIVFISFLCFSSVSGQKAHKKQVKELVHLVDNSIVFNQHFSGLMIEDAVSGEILLKREADKNTHNTAMARQSASADIDIQRGQWQLRRDIQDWEDKRLAKQSQEHRQNVERDSQIAWQREDALRRQRSQNSWYSSAATYDSNSFEQSTKRQEKRKYPHQDHTKRVKSESERTTKRTTRRTKMTTRSKTRRTKEKSVVLIARRILRRTRGR